MYIFYIKKNFWVYILANKNNSTLYIGVTSDLNRRTYEHKNHLLEGFTKKYDVTKLVYCEHVNNAMDAISREKQLKSWSRKKKEQLVESINPEWTDLTKEWE